MPKKDILGELLEEWKNESGGDVEVDIKFSSIEKFSNEKIDDNDDISMSTVINTNKEQTQTQKQEQKQKQKQNQNTGTDIEKNSKKKRNIIIGVVLLVVLIFGGGFGFYKYIQQNKNKTNKINNTNKTNKINVVSIKSINLKSINKLIRKIYKRYGILFKKKGIQELNEKYNVINLKIKKITLTGKEKIKITEIEGRKGAKGINQDILNKYLNKKKEKYGYYSNVGLYLILDKKNNLLYKEKNGGKIPLLIGDVIKSNKKIVKEIADTETGVMNIYLKTFKDIKKLKLFLKETEKDTSKEIIFLRNIVKQILYYNSKQGR